MLDRLLQRIIRVGSLSVRFPSGKLLSYGDGSGPEVVVAVSAAAARAIALGPDPGLGEAYMDGGVLFEKGDIWGLLEIAGRNQANAEPRRQGPVAQGLLALQRRLQQWNDRPSARRNSAHHYDLSIDLYRRFLDSDLQYTCASSSVIPGWGK